MLVLKNVSIVGVLVLVLVISYLFLFYFILIFAVARDVSRATMCQ